MQAAASQGSAAAAGFDQHEAGDSGGGAAWTIVVTVGWEAGALD